MAAHAHASAFLRDLGAFLASHSVESNTLDWKHGGNKKSGLDAIPVLFIAKVSAMKCREAE
jgi:hypothetical protein